MVNVSSFIHGNFLPVRQLIITQKNPTIKEIPTAIRKNPQRYTAIFNIKSIMSVSIFCLQRYIFSVFLPIYITRYLCHHQTSRIMAKTKYNLHLKGYVGGWDFDSDYVDFVLGKNTDKEVAVLIDSLGGQLNTALSISSAFRRHGNVRVHFVGMNASAATIASMGAKRITMDHSAMYLVHQCSQSFFEWGSMNATDMQHLINNLERQKADLDKLDANVAEMYAGRCKKKSADLLALMKVGGWLTAEEALAWGFVDELTDFDDESAPVLTDALAADFTAHGIPLPKMLTDNKSEDITAFRRFLQAFASVFHSQDKDHSKSSTETVTMKKTYHYICKALACDALESADDKTTLTTAQLDTIEADITAKYKEITDLTAQVAKLTQSNKDLEAKVQSLPADTTTNVVDDKKDGGAPSEKSDIEKFFDTTNSAQALFDSLP